MNKTTAISVFVLFTGILLSGCSKLTIDYEFDSSQSFSDIQGAFSDKASTNYTGYMYYFSTKPAKSGLPWNTATLHSPAAINGGNDVQQCWIQEEGSRRSLDFYCGGSAKIPAKPPTGTYQVNVGTKSFTFDNVTSRVIDTDLNNVYVPVIKLTMDGSGKISHIDWQWWKKETNNWVQPTTSELGNALEDAGFLIGQANWAGDRVNGEMALTTTGQVVPSAQSFTPGALRITISDKTGYSYGFEWR